jgi:micrococcal nuclease
MMRLLLVRLFVAVVLVVVLLNIHLKAEDAINRSQDNNIIKNNTIQVEDTFSKPQDDMLQTRDDVFETRKFIDIVRVVNGDTIKVHYGNKTEFVKLIGIDAPENRLSRKAKSEAIESGENLVTIISIGIDATRFLQSLIRKGETVTIEFDIETRGINGNLLGYVFLSDGRMLNEEIVKAGYASVINASPNIKYKERLLKAYIEAKSHKRGLWE